MWNVLTVFLLEIGAKESQTLDITAAEIVKVFVAQQTLCTFAATIATSFMLEYSLFCELVGLLQE